MNKLFNTDFEVGLRDLLILYAASPDAITIDRIAAYDFINVYGRMFGISENNLHGENNYNFSELASRRSSCKAALKNMVLDGYVSITKNTAGFCYSISDTGEQLVSSLRSEYAKEYLRNAKYTNKKYRALPDDSLVMEINTKAVTQLREV